MIEMQRILVEDHIHGLEHEAERIRAERERDRRASSPVTDAVSPNEAPATFDIAAIGGAPVPAPALYAVPQGADQASPRVRIGRWLVGVGTAIAGTEVVTIGIEECADGPCDEGPSPLSHAA
jgi:hypothetical protein